MDYHYLKANRGQQLIKIKGDQIALWRGEPISNALGWNIYPK